MHRIHSRSLIIPKIFLSLFFIFIFSSFYSIGEARELAVKEKIIKLADNQTLRPGGGDFFKSFITFSTWKDKVVFLASSDRGKEGIYLASSKGIQPVIAVGMKPDNKKNPFYSFSKNGLGDQPLPIFTNDQVLFYGGNYSEGSDGIYYLDGKRLYAIADQGMAVPGGARGLFITFSEPGFFDDNFLFIGKGEKENINGIYEGDKKGKLQILVDNSTSVPDGTGTFQNFLQIGYSRNKKNNEFAFTGIDSAKQLGLYFYKKGKLTKVADQKTEIPNGVGFFKSIDNVVYDDRSEQVMFIGRGVLGQVGIYLYSPSQDKLIKAVDQRDAIPDNKEVFTNFTQATLDEGTIAFIGSGEDDKKGLYLDVKGKLFKIISVLDKISNQEIDNIQLSRNALSHNYLGFIIQFKNRATALYLAELDY